MASDRQLAEYYAEMLAPLGDVTVKPMFTVFCFYINQKPVGFLVDGQLLVKTNEKMRQLWPQLPSELLFEGAVNPMWVVDNPDDQSQLLELYGRAVKYLPEPKPAHSKARVPKGKGAKDGYGSPLSDPDVMGKAIVTEKMRSEHHVVPRGMFRHKSELK